MYRRVVRTILLGALLGYFAIWVETSFAQSAIASQFTNEIRIVELQGVVEVFPAGATAWAATQTNRVLHPFDRLRTGVNSRVALRWSDQSIVPFGASTELEVLEPDSADAQNGVHLVRGIISFFHRDRPGRIRIITRGAVAGVEGTEFVLAVNDADLTTLSVIDGAVRFSNEQAALLLTNSQQAVAEPGKSPVRTAGFVANNILQWCFYYPAVLDPADLPLTPEEQTNLDESLAAYRAGDVLAALAKYPATPAPESDTPQVYHAALLLSVGQIEEAEKSLSALSATDASARPQRLAAALRRLVAAVKRQSAPAGFPPQLATEFLADSYYEQSRALGDASLSQALDLARQAANRAPELGFAWERVAELEFSFGRTSRALEALEKSLALAPRNAQALALKGFLLAAQNQTREAITWFDRALAVDSALGNAWLGRGLCRIRRGDAMGGREDLLVAAALEPQRAELRSYLGKAYANTGDSARAMKELQLAKGMDPHDPTAWLYSALVNQENSRINAAIRDLEKSEELNGNRSVYRSQLLLDQDQAVRSANLAAMYQDAGMSDVAIREAGRAVNYDYANYSAHLFLANSYSSQGDPNLINLRYETPAENEFLLANLLAPVSAGAISPVVSAQEYSPLLQRNRLGVVSSTEYLSRGAWTQSGAQYGNFEDFNYSLEAFYRTDPGQRANDDVEQRQLSLAVKQQITPQDSVFLQVKTYDANAGDVAQYYDQNMANPDARVNETQEPIVGLGYHHEWSPGVHTLFFATRLQDRFSVTNPAAITLLAVRPGDPPELAVLGNVGIHEKLVDKLEIYSGELQQIWEQPDHNTIVGGRAQYGHIDMNNRQIDALPPFTGFFPTPPATAAQQDISSLFKRFSVYGYHQWQVADPLQLIGGVTYDWLAYPENFQTAPVSGTQKTVDQISPKAGFIWNPLPGSTVRFAYTRSLSGASLDQSYQLEPSQAAGFIQSFRSIIPESVAGANAGASFETYGLSLEQKFNPGTYLGLSGALLNSDVRRTVGAFDSLDAFTDPVPSGLRQNLDYDEESLLFTANQLVNEEWSFGARYRLTRSVLNEKFVGVPDGLPNGPNNPPTKQRLEGVLHQVDLSAIYNHPAGFFAIGEASWYAQNNYGYTPGEPGDDFWQLNAFAGYRFLRRKAEVSLGLLNITDQNYKLNPLNTYGDLARERTIAVRFQLNF